MNKLTFNTQLNEIADQVKQEKITPSEGFKAINDFMGTLPKNSEFYSRIYKRTKSEDYPILGEKLNQMIDKINSNSQASKKYKLDVYYMRDEYDDYKPVNSGTLMIIVFILTF